MFVTIKVHHPISHTETEVDVNPHAVVYVSDLANNSGAKSRIDFTDNLFLLSPLTRQEVVTRLGDALAGLVAEVP